MSKAWKITGFIALVLMISLAVFFYWATWEGSPKEIVAVADKFKPESDWKQVTNQVIPPKTTCIEANCPSVSRSWETKKLLTKQEFETLLTRAGWRFDVEGNCLPHSNIHGTGEGVCKVSGTDEGYKIEIEVVGDYDNMAPPRLELSLGRINE